MDFRVISAITDFIFVSDKPQKADVIFLPGGSNPALPEAAAKLYREGFAPLVIPSGKYSVSKGKFCGVKAKADIYNKNYQTECEFYTDVLLKNGVSDNAISGEAEAGHTRDNADFSRKLTDEKGVTVKKAILVCKSFHARRCLCFYEFAFPETEFFVCPVDCSGITRDNWYTFEKGIDRVFGELYRCGWQFVDDIKKTVSESDSDKEAFDA